MMPAGLFIVLAALVLLRALPGAELVYRGGHRGGNPGARSFHAFTFESKRGNE